MTAETKDVLSHGKIAEAFSNESFYIIGTPYTLLL